MANAQQTVIAVIGAGTCSKEVYALSEQAGIALAKKQWSIICGGLGGVMEAVCKGAKQAGGTTIGILPGDNVSAANPFVDIAVATGMGIGRNIIIIRSAQVVLAIDGKYGTLSEIAFALQLDIPVIGINTWSVSDHIKAVMNIPDAINEIAKLVE